MIDEMARQARRRMAEQQRLERERMNQARRALNSPRISVPEQTSTMRLPGAPRPEPRGPKGFRQMGDETLGIMEGKAQQIRDAAKKKSALQRAGAEKGIAAGVGRSARQAGSGGRTETLSSIGADLTREAAATEAGAELAATDATLEARQFEAEKYVSPTEAKNLVESYIEGVEGQYAGVFGDDEAALADDIERWANEKSADGKTYLRSENERNYALQQVDRLRKYEENYFGSLFGSGGGRKIGWF